MDPAPFATVVTDLTTCHNTWFYRGVDRCFVPTETCRARALKMGLRPDQVSRPVHRSAMTSRRWCLPCHAGCFVEGLALGTARKPMQPAWLRAPEAAPCCLTALGQRRW